MDLEIKKNLRRRTEEIDYWRKRAGWYDDDISMTEYNNGVYDTYYQIDDDVAREKSKTASVAAATTDDQGLSKFLEAGAVVVAVAVALLVYRALAGRRGSSKERSSSNKKGTTDTKSRSSRSKSASRSRSSRSRSRSRRPGASVAGSSNYELMDEKSEAPTRKSSRSRSRSRKAGSSRSRSKSTRTPSTAILPPAIKADEKVLV